MQYELRPETILDVIEKIPDDRVDTFMMELTGLIHQAKLTYDVVKTLDPNAKAEIRKPFIWDDDGKGEITVNHYLGDTALIKTSKSVSNNT